MPIFSPRRRVRQTIETEPPVLVLSRCELLAAAAAAQAGARRAARFRDLRMVETLDRRAALLLRLAVRQ